MMMMMMMIITVVIAPVGKVHRAWTKRCMGEDWISQINGQHFLDTVPIAIHFIIQFILELLKANVHYTEQKGNLLLLHSVTNTSVKLCRKQTPSYVTIRIAHKCVLLNENSELHQSATLTTVR
jgi:hypothetical protein